MKRQQSRRLHRLWIINWVLVLLIIATNIFLAILSWPSQIALGGTVNAILTTIFGVVSLLISLHPNKSSESNKDSLNNISLGERPPESPFILLSPLELSRKADRIFRNLPSDEHRHMACDVFSRLISPGSTEQEDTIRRHVPLSEFEQADPAQEQKMRETLVAFINARLLTENQVDGITTIEISHERLIQDWELLVNLRKERHDEIVTQQWLSEVVSEWKQRGKPRDLLIRGKPFRKAQAWSKRNRPSKQEEAFLRASRTQQVLSRASLTILLLLLVSSMGTTGWYVFFQPKPTLVTTRQDSVVGSLRWCINNAPSGSTIKFAPGLSGTIELTGGDLVFAGGKQLTIIGPGASQLTISGGNKNASIDVSTGATVTLTGLSFKNSSETFAGAFLYNQGTLTVTHSIISGNQTTSDSQSTGAGIENTSTGSLTVMYTIISHNSVSGPQQGQGGGIDNGGKLTVTDSTFTNNSATSSGGIAIGGGIVNTQTGTVMVTGSTFSNNSASGQQYGQGGGIDNGGKLTVTDSTFANNTATGSSVAGFGGGISNSQTGTVMVTGSTFSNNSASGPQQGQGGGIDNEGKLTVTDSTFANNTAMSSINTALGGGIRNYRTGIVMVTSSTFSNNSVSGQQYGYGGGIFTSGKLTMVNSTFSNNTATSSEGFGLGGGIYTYQTGTVMVTGSTLSHNSATGKQEDAGGGIYTFGKLSIINSTLSNNIASGGKSYGGGIGFTGSQGSSTLIRFSTLYANTSGTSGGGIWINPTGSSLLTISSSIIAANSASAGPDIEGVLISGGYNLIENLAGVTGLNASSDKQVTLTELGISPTLDNNGGPTQTLALLPGSRAIDAVPLQVCSITIDQRGKPRPDGSENACDIGAFESSY